ncbi:PREDICTED: reticulon-4-interacting protein 1, mitochondrial [Vollenhovia emeryi]|uniref:reticulon-4-interacting protein 1, mitochondrial n=1 Tax=Vollenhovia emeryi TaxID=411798 RepID=UPI0005F47DE4|nr:PREDICTED: reticulon-4-interacting protein 1, mitochondrial [Vollenhovia emeryi]XP_011865976.1 PREDICTED: reticulon-4-interacting protein 1, mitochondrial [Vollenhovia emeryi]
MLRRAIPGLGRAVRTAHPRSLSKLSVDPRENPGDRMQAWQIHSYKGLDDLRLSSVRMPVITSPTDVLVKIEAASVNPIDVAMTDGYGNTLLNVIRKAKGLAIGTWSQLEELDLPLTLGRDFAGVVVSKGHDVGSRLGLGEEVWGVIPIEQQGCHANYVVVDGSLVNPRPRKLSHIEAASIPYAGLTAWSALWITGGLCYKTAIVTRLNRRVLVMGGSGGVGTLAVQMLKAWNMHVISTCSSDAVEMLQNLGADTVIDYKRDGADAEIISEGPYDMILDCANQGPEHVRTRGYPHDTYIALNSPLLKNFDNHGLIMGMAQNLGDLLKFNIPKVENRSCVKWGFFIPSQTGISVLQKFVEDEKIVPVVQQVYPFQDLPLAYERLRQGHLRGKVVIDMR